MLKVLAVQIADGIDIKQFKLAFKAEVIHEDSDELFYRIQRQRQQFAYLFKYGIV